MTHDEGRGVLAGGTRVAEFRVERPLGGGGFGATYLAWDVELEAWRAVKEYLPNGWRGDVWGRRLADGTVGPAPGQEEAYRRGLERFVAEGRVLANSRLAHAHIVRVYRCFRARGTAYLVMEHVDGRNLKEALKEAGGWWPEARVRPVLAGLADGLSAVHAAGLVHRDVSPHNVMLRAGDDSPVLIDFGTARKLEQRESGSLPLLKEGYAAIEQYRDEWEDHKRTPAYGLLTEADGSGRADRDQGPWTDVYGLGAVAYEALGGTAPKRASLRLLHDTLQPVSAVAQGPVSPELASAVDAALSLYPWRRPQSMAAWVALWPDQPSESPLPEPVHPPVHPPHVSPRRATPLPPHRGQKNGEKRGRRWWLYAAATVLVVTAIALARFVVPPGGDAGSAGTGGGADVTRVLSPAEVEAALGLDRAARQRIQEGLLAAGFDPGATNGSFGGDTRRAVRTWQAARGKLGTGFLDAADAEALRAAAAEAERQRLQAERREAERLEAERLEAERREAERREAERLEAERLEAERREAERLEAERREAERLEAERREAERLEAERLEAERLEAERRVQVFRDTCTGCPEMVVVPAGTFTMGSPASEEGRNANEGPEHTVRVGSFALGRYEVTRGEYAAFATATGRSAGNVCYGSTDWRGAVSWSDPGFAQTASHPVVCVDWEDARAYAAWLSRRTGASYRLPSESEWEYAARGGTRTSRYWGASSSGQCGHANGDDRRRFSAVCDDGHVFTSPVGTFAANRFGLSDMLGNVWEWVADCWHDDYVGAPTDGSAWGGSSGCRRVLRGGSWRSNPRDLRSAGRREDSSANPVDYIGFRVARTLD